jgi:hypothetical protein
VGNLPGNKVEVLFFLVMGLVVLVKGLISLFDQVNLRRGRTGFKISRTNFEWGRRTIGAIMMLFKF